MLRAAMTPRREAITVLAVLAVAAVVLVVVFQVTGYVIDSFRLVR